jgi:hypothetical protein
VVQTSAGLDSFLRVPSLCSLRQERVERLPGFGLDSTASVRLPVLSIVSTGFSFLLRLSNGQRAILGLFFLTSNSR